MHLKVAVLGCNGMLGSDLVKACEHAGYQVIGLDLPQVDIRDFNNVRENMPQVDWVFNCAAYTRVDDAEKHRADAFAVNAEGAHSVARVCARRGINLVHISTDYVFDGRHSRPYVEMDYTNPLGVYGTSKLAGEKAVRAEGGHFLIVRTQSLFGVNGPNFIRAIVKRLREDRPEPLRVVDDQLSSPTYTGHLAAALTRLVKLEQEGVVHVTASGECSWFTFAKAIIDRIKPGAEVVPIKSADLGRPAPRPAYSVLDNSLYISWTKHPMPTWEEGLDDYLKEEQFV